MIKIILVFLTFGSLFASDLKNHVTSQLPFINGWCSKEKAESFIDLVLSENPEVWVEIGVFGGSSLLPVLSALQFLGKGTAIAIDAWDRFECIRHFDFVQDKEDLRWWANLDLEQIYISFLDLINRNGLQNFCKIVRKSSEAAAQEIGPIDVLHIDGNHSETASVLDVQLYLPKVKQGGFIWYNDCLWEKRQAALDLLLEECQYVKLIDNGNCILLRKV